MTPAVAVSADPLSLIDRAAVLAQTLALPLSPHPEDQHFSFVLVLTPQRLELRRQGRHVARSLCMWIFCLLLCNNDNAVAATNRWRGR